MSVSFIPSQLQSGSTSWDEGLVPVSHRVSFIPLRALELLWEPGCGSNPCVPLWDSTVGAGAGHFPLSPLIPGAPQGRDLSPSRCFSLC